LGKPGWQVGNDDAAIGQDIDFGFDRHLKAISVFAFQSGFGLGRLVELS
jgi:hypothetical protein